jgi:serine/threonine protein kinase
VNDVIGGQYKILKILGGEGISGRGVVFICAEDHNIIALKSIQTVYMSNEAMVHAFKREALAWVHLERHPYIVRAQYVINIDERPYIALDYIAPNKKGINTLTQFMKTPLSMKKILKWCIQICYAMEYAQSKGITPHRDIKPDNIMIDIQKNVKLTDFGLAMFVGQERKVGDWRKLAEKGEVGLTFLRISKEEEVGGTVPWMPAEQFEGDADVRSDIYSTGICMYQMVNNGKLPFLYGTIDDYYMAHKKLPLPILDNQLFPIIKKCCGKKVEDRYQNFKELRLELEKLYRNRTGKDPSKPPEEKEFQAWEHNNKGVSYVELGFLDEAADEFEQTLKLNPYSANAHNNLGFIYKKQGLIEEAIKEFKEALKTKPHSVEALTNLIEAFEEKENFQEAAEVCRSLVRIKPNYIMGHYNLGKCLGATEDYEDALYYYKNFLDYAPKDPIFKEKIKLAKKQMKLIKKKMKQ